MKAELHQVGRETGLGLAGVLEANVEVGSASLKFDEAKLSRQDIEAAIKKAGYKVAAS